MAWRVLHLVSTSDIGGTERSLLYHLEAGAASGGDGFEEEIACFQGGGGLIREAQALGVRAEHLEVFSPLDWALRARAKVRDLLERRRPDLVHVYGLRADVVARAPAKASGARVVSAIHSTDPWRRAWHSALDRGTARHVDLFLSNSPGGRGAALRREKHPPAKVAVSAQGIPDLPRLDPAERASLRDGWGLGADGLAVCCVANFRWMKGHADLIRAFGLASERFPSARLVLVGGGPELAPSKALAEGLGLGGSVAFPGRVEEPWRVLRASDLFALASRHEGLPTSILEAMAAGLPVLTTEWEGAREVFSGVAEFAPPADPPRLAEALLGLLESPERRQELGSRARQRWEAEFSIARARARQLAFYRDLLEPRGKGASGPGMARNF